MKKDEWVLTKDKKVKPRKWGDLKTFLLNSNDQSADILAFVLVKLEKNKQMPPIQHVHTHEWIYVTEGSAVAILNDKKVLLKKGDYLYLPPKVWHSFSARAKGVVAIGVHFPKLDSKNPDILIKKV